VVAGHAQSPVVFELGAAIIAGVAQDQTAGGPAWMLVDVQGCAGLVRMVISHQGKTSPAPQGHRAKHSFRWLVN
jgi:hypothetical protein